MGSLHDEEVDEEEEGHTEEEETQEEDRTDASNTALAEEHPLACLAPLSSFAKRDDVLDSDAGSDIPLIMFKKRRKRQHLASKHNNVTTVDKQKVSSYGACFKWSNFDKGSNNANTNAFNLKDFSSSEEPSCSLESETEEDGGEEAQEEGEGEKEEEDLTWQGSSREVIAVNPVSESSLEKGCLMQSKNRKARVENPVNNKDSDNSLQKEVIAEAEKAHSCDNDQGLTEKEKELKIAKDYYEGKCLFLEQDLSHARSVHQSYTRDQEAKLRALHAKYEDIVRDKEATVGRLTAEAHQSREEQLKSSQKYERQVGTLRQEVHTLRSKYQMLEDEVKSVSSSKGRAKRKHARVEKKCNEKLENACLALDTERARAESLLAILQNRDAEIDILRNQEIPKLTNKIKSLNKSRTRNRKKFKLRLETVEGNTISEKAELISKYEESLAKLQEKIDCLISSQESQLKDEKSSWQLQHDQEIKRLEDERSKTLSQHNSWLEMVKEKQDCHLQQLEIRDTTISQLEEELTALKCQLKKLRATNDSMSKEMEASNSRAKLVLSEQRQTIESLKEKISKADGQVPLLSVTLREKVNQVKDLEKRLEAKEEEFKTLEMDMSLNSILVSSLNSQNATLTKKREELELTVKTLLEFRCKGPSGKF